MKKRKGWRDSGFGACGMHGPAALPVAASKRDQGVGLANVFVRLVLCKGKDGTLDYEALQEDGAMVTLGWRRDADAKLENHRQSRDALPAAHESI